MPTIYNTGDKTTDCEKILVYGEAGSGKTPLAATLQDGLIVASEPGLKSVKHNKLPYIVATNYEEADDVLKWCKTSSEARKFKGFYFDSISALSEGILFKSKRKYNNDARKYSPETFQQTMEIVNGFLGINTHHIVMTSKALRVVDNLTGNATAECYAAVPKLGPAIPYHFDNVLFISRHSSQDGAEYSALRCRHNNYAICRNRSGMLALWEPANIQHVINKSNGVV